MAKHTVSKTSYGQTKMTAGDESTAAYINTTNGGGRMRVHIRADHAKVTRTDTLECHADKVVDTIVVDAGQSTFYIPIAMARAVASKVEEVDRAEAEAAQCAKAGCNGDHSKAAVEAGTNIILSEN